MSFGRERALYQLIGSKKAQIQTLRDHIYLFTHLAKNNKIITKVRHYINEIL